jgi:hypothetical protein
MPLPQFSTGGQTLVFSRGDVFPVQRPVKPSQRIGYAWDGTVFVATLAPPERMLPLTVEGMGQDDYTGLLAWLDTIVNWAAVPFTYTDVNSVAYYVRYVGDTLDLVETAPSVFSGTLPLRVETA